MIHAPIEGSVQVPVIDIVSFSFDKQNGYDDEMPLLVDADEPSRYLNNKTYRLLVRRLIAGFKAYGLQQGDSVLCQITNSYLYPALFMGIVGAGGIWFGSNTANQRYEVDHFIQLATPKFVITEQSSLPIILPVCEERQIAKQSIFVLDTDTFPLYTGAPSAFWGCSDAVKESQAIRSCTDLLDHGEQDWRTVSSEAEAKKTPAAYFPTSGTTGLPKLAMVSHWNLVAHHLMLHQETPYRVRRLMSLPLFHLFATSFTFVQPTRHGHTTYVMKRWNLQKYLESCDRYQVTETYMAPPMLVAMIQSDLDIKHLLKSVRYAGVGGAPCDAVCINKMRSLLTDGTMSSVWGMTEVGVATTFRYGDHDETGSIGRLMRGMEGKLVDADGNVVDRDGEPGELYIRSEGIMLGYRNMELPEDEQEWFRTGDVCCCRDGKLYIVGRAKELIKVKGWQVAPAEIEAVLLQHPDIIDVAVCGTMAKNGTDETPRAYVIRQKKFRETEMITAEQVYEYARTRLASYKAIDGGVCFVEEIPRTASGKIQRAKLARMDQYRRSVTTILLAASAAPIQKERISEIKDTAMEDIDAAPLRQDTGPVQKGTKPSARQRSRASSSSSEGLSLGKLRMKPRRKSTFESSNSDNSSLTSPVGDKKIKKRKTPMRKSVKRLVKAFQAAGA